MQTEKFILGEAHLSFFLQALARDLVIVYSPATATANLMAFLEQLEHHRPGTVGRALNDSGDGLSTYTIKNPNTENRTPDLEITLSYWGEKVSYGLIQGVNLPDGRILISGALNSNLPIIQYESSYPEALAAFNRGNIVGNYHAFFELLYPGAQGVSKELEIVSRQITSSIVQSPAAYAAYLQHAERQLTAIYTQYDHIYGVQHGAAVNSALITQLLRDIRVLCEAVSPEVLGQILTLQTDEGAPTSAFSTGPSA